MPNVDEVMCARCAREIKVIIARVDGEIEKQMAAATEETLPQATTALIAAVERAIEDIRATLTKFVSVTQERHGWLVAESVRTQAEAAASPIIAALQEQMATLRSELEAGRLRI